MEKTKFGVSAALLSMLCYFTGYANFTACILLFIAILVWCDSNVAKKNASQAVVLSSLFSIISLILNWLSNTYMDIVSTVSGWLNDWFEWYKAYEIMSNLDIMGFLSSVVNLLELILMIIFVIKSIKGKDVKIPVVTKMVDKHFGDEEVA